MQRNVRLSDELGKQVREAAKARQFASVAAFIREALRNEVTARAGELATAEERLADAMGKTREEARRAQVGQQALFNLLDTFVKVFLTCVPPPAEPTKAKAQAQQRYTQFMKEAAKNLGVEETE